MWRLRRGSTANFYAAVFQGSAETGCYSRSTSSVDISGTLKLNRGL